MPSPSVILPKPLIMIQSGDSYLSGAAINTPINFGNIVAVYDTCDLFEVGENVSYITTGQTSIYYSSVQYVIIEETNILTNEGSSPP